MAYRFKEKEIIMILGAGASVEAGIPHSAQMIEQLESLVESNDVSWNDLHDLYYYIKGTFEYGNAIRRIGNSSYQGMNYNIETLYVALDELSKRDEHLLFPFIGAWNPKLSDVSGDKFKNVLELKQKIYDKIRKWVGKTQEENIEYYENLFRFRVEYESSLRIFSMNYDLCIEKTWNSWSLKNKGYDIELERGFYPVSEAETNKKRCWDWKRLDETQTQNEKQPIFLYKLHGSIDWKTEGEKIKFEDGDGWSEIDINDSVFIFGETNKLHYNDPFFYLFQEFRKWTLSSKLMIALGYSFSDPHINSVIRQSLLDNPERKLLVISPYGFKDDKPINEEETNDVEDKIEEKRTNRIKEIHSLLRLEDICESQIAYWFYGAKSFMNDKLNIDDLALLFPEPEEDLIQEVEIEDSDEPSETVAEVASFEVESSES